MARNDSLRTSAHRSRYLDDLEEDIDLTGKDDLLDDLVEIDEDDGFVEARPSRGKQKATPPLTRERDKRSKPGREPPRKGVRERPRLTDDDDWDDADEFVPRRERERDRVMVSEPFKCRNCRAFIGEPATGGRNRNHCPLCLYSLHVDLKTPGDRASECRSLMQPIGTFYRAKGEQMVVHRCLGCDAVRYNRIAADDNPILLNELPVMDAAELPGYE